ncbi:KTSC domain-containing protein [Kitasatospora sp. GP82]|uniref:KTSC domain-containing protein n=1 Tax=Kitasatospora sp. GP82 TaxID=3035089 RepID=UPI0024737C11|nr:KTSC domain-containing protein [Kitasatospora sp. GP82]
MRDHVVSSCLRSVGYDAEEHVLEIEFVTSTVYRYTAVPRRVHRALLAADSLGRYFNREVRGRYEYRKVS